MMHDLWNLGPYGDFIWPAYAVSALALGGAAIWTLLAWRRARRHLAWLGGKL